MKKYYKSIFLTNEHLLIPENIDKSSYYYEVEFISDINCLIAKAYFQNRVINVIFYDVDFNKDFYDYTLKNFGNIKITTFQNINNYLKVTKIYVDGSLVSIWKYRFDYLNRLDVSILQDDQNMLVEYRQSIYDDENNHIQEKIFYADSWTIHTEKMI